MSIQKTGSIVRRLEKLTEQGKLEWEPTEKEDVFQVSFPSFSVRLSKKPSQTEEGVDYIVSIYNSDGTLLESESDVNLREVLNEPGESYKTMKRLYDSARGYALGIEQALDNVIATLGEEDDIPF